MAVVLLLEVGWLSIKGTVATGLLVTRQLAKNSGLVHVASQGFKKSSGSMQDLLGFRLRIRNRSLLQYSLGQQVTSPPQIQG